MTRRSALRGTLSAATPVSRTLLAGCVALVLSTTTATATTRDPSAGRRGRTPVGQARPNIVLVYVDDMGWRDLGIQGSKYYETPNIDKLAARGMRFSNAYANAPNCAPSRAALLSGQYAPRTGIYTVGSAARGRAADRKLIPVQNIEALRLDVVTIAEAVRAAGYSTGHVGKWHLGGQGFGPAEQGFSWTVAGDDAGSPPSHFFPYENAQRSIPGLERGAVGEYLADRLTDEAIGFIERNRSRPFFLYLSHYGVHTPIQGPAAAVQHFRAKPADGGHSNAEYAAMVSAVDTNVGRLLEALDRMNLAANTLVIFTSDNGGFGPVTSMVPLRGSKGTVYEGGIRVPLIIRWPARVKANVTSDVPVIGTDFHPTIRDVAGTGAPASQPMDGRSLRGVLEGTGSSGQRDLFWHVPVYLEADRSVTGPWRSTPASVIRRGDYKLVHFFEGDQWELYNVKADISESRNLATSEPARMAELRTALESWWSKIGAFIPKPK